MKNPNSNSNFNNVSSDEVDKYFAVNSQIEVIEKALVDDYRRYLRGLNRDSLELLASVEIDLINKERELNGADPIKISEIDDNALVVLINPDWNGQIAKSFDDSNQNNEDKWTTFKDQYPPSMHINLDGLREMLLLLDDMKMDTSLVKQIDIEKERREKNINAAKAFIDIKNQIKDLENKIRKISTNAVASGRGITDSEKRKIESYTQKIDGLLTAEYKGNKDQISFEEVFEEVKRIIDFGKKADYDKGVVLTSGMQQIIEELVPSLVQGKPALLVGETGAAKTALCKWISRNIFGSEPELVSGYSDITSYQIMGKPILKNDNGVTVSDFSPGPLVRAMMEGKPIILDEVNAMPPEFLKRLNVILQLRPGDSFTVQEDGEFKIVIQPGFVVLCTANEKSDNERYQGVEEISVELLNRFVPNIVRVNYPDHDIVYGQYPRENMEIARTAFVDRFGNYQEIISEEELLRFVRACHVTQQVFSGNYGQGFKDMLSSDNIADNQPGLEKNVIAPRTMVAILGKVMDSGGKISLNACLESHIKSINHPNDKKLMIVIFRNHGFLGTVHREKGSNFVEIYSDTRKDLKRFLSLNGDNSYRQGEHSRIPLNKEFVEWMNNEFDLILSSWNKHSNILGNNLNLYDIIDTDNPEVIKNIKKLYDTVTQLKKNKLKDKNGELIADNLELVAIPWKLFRDNIDNLEYLINRFRDNQSIGYDEYKPSQYDSATGYLNQLIDAINSNQLYYNDNLKSDTKITLRDYLDNKINEDGDWGLMLTSSTSGLEDSIRQFSNQYPFIKDYAPTLKEVFKSIPSKVNAMGLFEWLAQSIQNDSSIDNTVLLSTKIPYQNYDTINQAVRIEVDDYSKKIYIFWDPFVHPIEVRFAFT